MVKDEIRQWEKGVAAGAANVLQIQVIFEPRGSVPVVFIFSSKGAKAQ